MRSNLRIVFLHVLLIVLASVSLPWEKAMAGDKQGEAQAVHLPPPDRKGRMSVEAALNQRRSVRSFTHTRLSLQQLSQLLWAAQGQGQRAGHRTAPSAGALYPLELYLLAAEVDGLEAGIYHYRPKTHSLIRVVSGDRRTRLAATAYGQLWIKDSPAVLVIAAKYARTTAKYGQRGRRYVYIEAGAVAENVYLQATALGLGTTYVGAFLDSAVAKVMGLERDYEPLALLPLGWPR